MAQIGATFTGIVAIERASFTLTHGVRPSRGQIEFAPQVAIPAVIGNLVVSDGTTSFALVGAKLDSASFIRGGGGYAVAATVLDRRWKWAFGEVYGEYNIRGADGTVVPDTQKTPFELADILLTAMGESGVPLGALPPEPLPRVVWNGNNPADELRRLCDLWGCRIGLDITGACRIWKEGVGATVPSGPIERSGGELNPPEAPDSVRVLFAPTLIGARLALEAVGRDIDGVVKPIDQLSYTPTDGWQTEPDQQSASRFPNVTGEQAIVAASETVFRWYRVVIPAAGLVVPGVGTVTALEQILPILDRQVQHWFDPAVGASRPKPVKIYGTYWIRNSGTPKNSTTSDNFEVPVGFRVLTELGVLAFEEPMRKFGGESVEAYFSYPAADLVADIAFGVRAQTQAYHRWTYEHFTGLANGTGSEPVHAEDAGGILLSQDRANPNLDPFTWVYNGEGTPATLNNRAVEYVAGALAKYGSVKSEEITYSGIQPVTIDGLNVQVNFHVGRDGAATVLSRVRESDVFAVPYRKQRPITVGGQTSPELAAFIEKLDEKAAR